MSRYACEETRDLVPLLVRGQLLPHDVAGAEAHLASCAECATEAELVRALSASAPATPAALEARVVLAVRRPHLGSSSPSRLAMAATLGAAVLGGSMVFERWLQGVDDVPVAFVAEENAVAGVSWAVTVDPLLHGSSSLTQLSVEELEMVLEELDS